MINSKMYLINQEEQISKWLFISLHSWNVGKCVHTWWKSRVLSKLNGSLKHLLIKVNQSLVKVCYGFSLYIRVLRQSFVYDRCVIFLSAWTNTLKHSLMWIKNVYYFVSHLFLKIWYQLLCFCLLILSNFQQTVAPIRLFVQHGRVWMTYLLKVNIGGTIWTHPWVSLTGIPKNQV